MAFDLDCPTCQTDDHVAFAKSLTGTPKRLRCERCGYEWLRGEPAPQEVTMPTLARSGRSLPGLDALVELCGQHTNWLKTESWTKGHYNSTHPNPTLKSALEPFALVGT